MLYHPGGRLFISPAGILGIPGIEGILPPGGAPTAGGAIGGAAAGGAYGTAVGVVVGAGACGGAAPAPPKTGFDFYLSPSCI